MHAIGDDSSDVDHQRELFTIVRTALTQSTVLVTLGAVWLYIMMSLTYDAFYGPLGVDPSDVGLSYTTILARSTGLGLLLSISIIGIVLSVIVDWIFEWIGSGIQVRRRRAIRLSVNWFWVAALLLLFSILTTRDNITRAGHAAAAVRQGRAVVPIGRFFTVLPLRADPVAIQPAGEAKAFPAIAGFRCDPTDYLLPCDKLLYLGQANGVVVLYNATKDQSVHLPASSVVLRISNCWSRDSLDIACLNRYH